MTLKSAAFLALIGSILVAALRAWIFFFDILNVIRGLVPAVDLFSSFLYAFAALTVAVFFYVFHKAHA